MTTTSNRPTPKHACAVNWRRKAQVGDWSIRNRCQCPRRLLSCSSCVSFIASARRLPRLSPASTGAMSIHDTTGRCLLYTGRMLHCYSRCSPSPPLLIDGPLHACRIPVLHDHLWSYSKRYIADNIVRKTLKIADNIRKALGRVHAFDRQWQKQPK